MSTAQAYITGEAGSGDFPTTPGAYDPSFNGGQDVFVVKLSASGDSLGFATFLGGNSSEFGNAIAIDTTGRAYVAGDTSSSDFPVSASAFDTSLGGFSDAFLARLAADGHALEYATFVGGAASEQGNDLAVDATGRMYLTGFTTSSDFPTTPGAFDTSYGGVPSEMGMSCG